mmetsp:Transcript_48687/g.139186  ORF Transcript_48687/g.139186 Transcript_48687/m.139186 type:complete len:192 (-) Transcript_48687:76-651(-)
MAATGRTSSRLLVVLALCAATAWVLPGRRTWVSAGSRAPGGRPRRPALRAAGGDSGEFDFGEYEAPSGVVVEDAEEEENPDLAPPEAEVFLQRETGNHVCGNCGWEYSAFWGFEDYAPGTAFKDLPSNFRCPECRVSKDQFKVVVEEVAGFADNQDYGFGFNTWTAGQKNIIIWGGLGVGFFALLGGYLLD